MNGATSASEPATFRVVYETENVYASGAFEAMYDLLVVPAETPSQHVVERTVAVEPDASVYDNPNAFGFTRTTVRIGTHFKRCSIRSTSILVKQPVNPYDFIPLSPVEELAVIGADGFSVDHHLFLLQTPYTTVAPDDVPVAFSPKTGVWDWLRRLNGQLFADLVFDDGRTDVTTTACEALGAGGGVCQDFTHIFVGSCRAHGIPCRYAAGYLDQGNKRRGSAFLHAWAEAFVPGAGYVGFDPTNGVLVDSQYLKVCHGTDYADCAPIRGVVHSPGRQETEYRVTVEHVARP